MSFDWTQYLFLAQELTKPSGSSPNRDARLRSAVSRAYYAAFCTARNYLRDDRKELIPSNVKAHKVVRDIFDSATDKRGLSIAKNLDRLRNDRNKADYDDHELALQSMSEFALKLCQSIFVNIRALKK